jgi:hypothetical protein
MEKCKVWLFREREGREIGSNSETDCIRGKGGENVYALKVPRQCPLVLLV